MLALHIAITWALAYISLYRLVTLSDLPSAYQNRHISRVPMEYYDKCS
jgi:hypothetical protein